MIGGSNMLKFKIQICKIKNVKSAPLQIDYTGYEASEQVQLYLKDLVHY